MKKTIKQIFLNVVLIGVSILAIYIGRCVSMGGSAEFEDCLNSDFVFVLITSLASVIFWRIVEDIKGGFIVNVIDGGIAVELIGLYGVSMVESLELSNVIYGSFWAFVVAYILENVIIICHFANVNFTKENPNGLQQKQTDQHIGEE